MMFRAGTVAAAALVLAGSFASGSTVPAGGGWGSTDCDQNPTPACELLVGSDPAPPSAGPPSSDPGPSRGRGGGTAQPAAPAPVCTYTRSEFQPPPDGVQTVAFIRRNPTTTARNAVLVGPRSVSVAQQPGQDSGGAWYDWVCDDGRTRNANYRPPIWIPDGQQPGAAPQLPTPAQLADRARRQLKLPTPTIAVSPAGTQLVNLPAWLWLDGGWADASATAAVPGISVTATATPVSVTWSMGDGAEVTCTGAGTPFRPGGDPAAPSPDCGHTYGRSSAAQPGETFAVSATVHWTVTWAGAGQAGTFPDLTSTGAAAFRVAEAQALNVGGG